MSVDISRSRTDRPGGRWWPAGADARRLLAAHLVSYAGTVLAAVGLPVLAFQLTGSAAHTAALVGLGLVPYVVLGLPVATYTDRADRRAVMVVAESASAALSASVGLAALADRLTIGHLYLAVAGLGTAFVFFDAANFGAVPRVARDEGVGRYLARQWTLDATMQVAGPVVTGAIVATAGAGVVPAVDAVTFGVSAVVLRRIEAPLRAAGPGGRLADRLAAGARFLWSNRVVRSLTLAGIGNSMTAGAVLGLLVPLSVDRLGLSDDDGRIAVLYTAGAVGGLAAARLLALLAPRVRLTGLVAGALAAATVAAAALGAQRNLVGAAIAYGVVVVATQVVILNAITVRQRVTPDELQGRVNVLARMVSVAGLPVGTVLAGLAVPAVGVGPTVAMAGAGTALAAALVLLGPLRPELRPRGDLDPAWVPRRLRTR